MNDQKRRQEESATARRQFAQSVARGQLGAMDRFGQPIEAGDQLMVRTPFDLVFTVVTVNPLLDPRAPAGLMDVVCTVTFPLRIPAGQPYTMAHVVSKRPAVAGLPGTDHGEGAQMEWDTEPPDPSRPATGDRSVLT